MDSRKLAIVVVLIFARHVWSAEPKEITPDVVAVAKGNNEFAAELYAHLAAEESSNLFFSPYSISTVLAMTCAGARGETAEQMFKVLHFPLPQPKLHPAFAKLRAQLTPSGKVPAFQLRTAKGRTSCRTFSKRRRSITGPRSAWRISGRLSRLECLSTHGSRSRRIAGLPIWSPRECSTPILVSC
jgi:hypothetical protein